MHARTADDVGSLIRERRLARGMSQAELAVATGTSRQWIVDLERGKPTLALGLVLRALTAVGLTLRVDAAASPAADAGHGSVDLDAILARARTPVSESIPSPASAARRPTKRRVKSPTRASKPPTATRGKKRA